MRAVDSPLPHHLIFALTMYGQCNQHSLVGRWSRNLELNFCPGQDLSPKPLDWQYSILTTKPPRMPSNNRDNTNPKILDTSGALTAHIGRYFQVEPRMVHMGHTKCLWAFRQWNAFKQQRKVVAPVIKKPVKTKHKVLRALYVPC